LHNSEAIATFKGRQTIITASHNFYRDWQGGTGPPAAALAAEKSVQFAGLTGTQAALNSSRSLSPQRGDISSMFSKPPLLVAPLAAAVPVSQQQQHQHHQLLELCSDSDAQEGRRSRMSSNSSSQERRGRLVSSSSAPTLNKQLSALQRQSSNTAGVTAAISVVGTAAQLSCQSSCRTVGTSASTRKPSIVSSSALTGGSPGRSRQSSISVSPASRRASAAPSNSPTACSGAKKDNSVCHTAPMLAAAMTAAATAAAAAAAAKIADADADADAAAATAAAAAAAATGAAAALVAAASLRHSSSRSVLAPEAESDSVEEAVTPVYETVSETVTAKMSPRGHLKLPDVASTSSTQRPSSRCGSVSPRLPQVSASSAVSSGTNS
jgi:hypothetical protein